MVGPVQHDEETRQRHQRVLHDAQDLAVGAVSSIHDQMVLLRASGLLLASLALEDPDPRCLDVLLASMALEDPDPRSLDVLLASFRQGIEEDMAAMVKVRARGRN